MMMVDQVITVSQISVDVLLTEIGIFFGMLIFSSSIGTPKTSCTCLRYASIIECVYLWADYGQTSASCDLWPRNIPHVIGSRVMCLNSPSQRGGGVTHSLFFTTAPFFRNTFLHCCSAGREKDKRLLLHSGSLPRRWDACRAVFDTQLLKYCPGIVTMSSFSQPSDTIILFFRMESC